MTSRRYVIIPFILWVCISTYLSSTNINSYLLTTQIQIDTIDIVKREHSTVKYTNASIIDYNSSLVRHHPHHPNNSTSNDTNLHHLKKHHHQLNHTTTITYVPLQNYPSGIYSGMWYQSIPTMLHTNFSSISFLEGVSLKPFRESRSGRPLITADWLDFSVEHWSKFVKHFSSESKKEVGGGSMEYVVVQQRVGELFWGYIVESLERKRIEMELQQQELYEDEVTVGRESMTTDGRTRNYTRAHPSSSSAAAAASVQHTIAIIPIRIQSASNPQHNIGYDYNYNLTILQTTATITSLWKHNFPRIVIAGVSPNEHAAFQEIKKLLQQQGHLQLIPTVELVYVHMEGREEDWRNVPQMAMVEFQRAIRESRQAMDVSGRNNDVDGIDNETNETITSSTTDDIERSNFVQSWLGTNPKQWKHIYFTEPDLILQTRQTALPSLVQQLNKGWILTAHRLQPLPHMRQFDDIVNTAIETNNAPLVRYLSQKLLPDFGSFHHANITSLDPYRVSCCDQGNYYPANVDNPNVPVKARQAPFHCPGTFELCGFQTNVVSRSKFMVTREAVVEAHKFLMEYNLIALEEGYGTGVPLVHSHQRVCRVQEEVCL